MAKYRLLSDSMWVGENRDRRAFKGEEVEVTNERQAQKLLAVGAIVEESKATDEQKKLWEQDTKAQESQAAFLEEKAKREADLLKQGGTADNRTVPAKEAPKVADAKK